MRGAEAVLDTRQLLKRKVVVKSRRPKDYRIAELDSKLRAERTRSEARLLNRAKIAGILCPTVLEVDDFDITMSFVQGKRPHMNEKQAHETGVILAKLHEADIIHGDYTPANLIASGSGIFVIDFGLGYVSNDIEDKAVDVFTMLRSIGNEKAKAAFTEGYGRYGKSASVMKRVKDVEKRVRYAF